MDDVKLFAKNEKELEIPIQSIRIYMEDIGMEFDIEKCAMFIMKKTNSRKKRCAKSKIIRLLGEKENYKYLEILKAVIIKKKQR